MFRYALHMHSRTYGVLILLPALYGAPIVLSPALLAAPPAAPAQAPKGIDWSEKVKRQQEFYRAQEKTGAPFDQPAYDALMKELVAGIDCSTLSIDELMSGWQILAGTPESRSAALARAQTLATGTEATSAKAAVFVASSSRSSDAAGWPGHLTAAFNHPGLPAYFAEAGPRPLVQLTSQVSGIDAAQRGPFLDKAIAWGATFTPETSAAQLRSVVGYVTALRDLMPSLSPEQFDSVRTQMLATVSAAAAKAEADSRPDDAAALGKLATRLDSSAMKGQLLNHSAPAVTFNWLHDRSGTPSWKTLENLKGKIVVLDFWATWCGPCVGSFPNVRELRAHYSTDDVVIIGVTSIQGNHYWKGRPKVETKGNPDLEKSLMSEYMNEMDITWTVGFTDQEVFNPEFDVNGIPHLAIIDAKGVLRHNGLHPSMPMAEKTRHIDALLTEAGKTPPPAPAAPTTETGTCLLYTSDAADE